MKLRAEFDGKACRLELREHTHLVKYPAVIGQERFADVKAGEPLLLEEQDPFASEGEESRGGAAARAASNDYGVEDLLTHPHKKAQVRVRASGALKR